MEYQSASVGENHVSSIAQNFIELHHAIRRSAEAAGRDPNSIRLIAVSKTKPLSAIMEAYDAGARFFGENYIQEMVVKHKELQEHYADIAHAGGTSAIEWHCIGHIQTNKVRMIAEFITWVHSVDSVKVGREISKYATKYGRTINILIQVNTSGEISKSGCLPSEAQAIVQELITLPGLAVRGLMTIPEAVETAESARPAFRILRMLRDSITELLSLTDFTELSMGMSHDYLVAIEEGATMVRVGTAIFGERSYFKQSV
jgi:PLP dependent protein